MKKRAAALCGAALVVAGTFTAVPAQASAPHLAKPTWKKCGTADYPTLQCASVQVPLDHANPDGRKITLALSRVPHTAKKYQGPAAGQPRRPRRQRTRIPSVIQLQQEFGIAGATGQKVHRQLRDDGLIYTKPGVGSFVAQRKPEAPTDGD